MPIHCDLPIESMSQAEFGALDYSVMSHAFDTQNDIGRLAQEHIYGNDLRLRLLSAGISCDCEVAIRMTHGDYAKQLFLDLVAIVHLLGGIERVERLLPLNRSGNELGSQRFYVISPDEAIHLTAFSDVNEAYDRQVNRLLSISPLRAIHRINIAAHRITFTTVAK